MGVLRFIRRVVVVVLVLAVVAIVVGLAWVLTHRDQARAWRQVTTIGAQLTDLGSVDAVGEALAGDTKPAREEQVGPLPATFVAPDAGGPHPAIVLLVPEGTTGDEERRVRDAQHAIAGAGLGAWAVRVPAVDDALVDASAHEDLVTALGVIAGHESTEEHAMSVIAAGPTASLVLVAAADSAVADDLRAIVAVQPIADLRGLVELATTGRYIDSAGVEREGTASPELRASAGRAVMQAVRAELPTTNRVLATLLDAAEESDDPLAALELVPPNVAGPQLRPVLDVLRADSAQAFDAAWDRLPASFRDAALERSPLPFAPRVRARVLVVEASDDAWAKADVARLADELRDSRSLSLDAEDPGALVEDPAAIRDVLSVSEWWMRRAGRS